MAKTLASGISRTRFPVGEQRETQLGEIAPEARERFPFYFQLPYHDPVALLRWRVYCRKRCVADLAFRAAIWEMCRADVAFWAVTFGVIFEPRPTPRWLPFHLWTDQVSVLCIAKGTPVVTGRGLVPIEKVTANDKVWDGVEYVSQGGAVYKGYKETIESHGVRMTPDHEVLTKDGWKIASVARQGYARAEVRMPDDYLHERAGFARQANRSSYVRLRAQSRETCERFEGLSEKRQRVLQPLLSATTAKPEARELHEGTGECCVSLLEQHDGALLQPKCCWLQELRRARTQSPRAMAQIREFLSRYGRSSPRNDARQDRQRRQLRAGELSMGHGKAAASQQEDEPLYRNSTGRNTSCGRFGTVGHKFGNSVCSQQKRLAGREDVSTGPQEAEVYDLLNCGPRRRFVVMDKNGQPLIVHNCWLTEIFGVRSASINKTRGIGMSWLLAAFCFHKWLFEPEAAIGLVSKDKDLLDSPNPNSLLGKLQYLYDGLPLWARFTSTGRPLLNRLIEKNSFTNVENDAVIQGFVSSSMKLRGLRFTMIFADEFAFYERNDQDEWMTSAGGTSDCIVYVSTWGRFDDKFHYIVHEDESSLLKISAFWWNNHERWRGAYKVEAGRVVLVDKDYRHPPDYQFDKPELVDEGTLRSPWVDAELSKPGLDRLKALRDIFGMSVCVAGDTRVVTDRGVIPIMEVTPADKVWDGVAWVRQEGVAFNGVQNTIERLGIHFTSNHKVLSRNGWVKASEITEEFIREAVRPPDRIAPIRAKQGQGVVNHRGSGGTVRYHSRNINGPPPSRVAGEPIIRADSKIQRVYDLVNCGPRRRFAVLDGSDQLLLISNCERTNSFFGQETRAAIRDSNRAPEVQGLLDTTSGKLKILPTLKSNLRLWGGVPEKDRGPYVMGCDLAQGVGSAFSVATVLDKGGEQILEYGTNEVKITAFAFDVVQIARWLAGDQGDGWVLIDFEANGQQAKPFLAEILRLLYGHVHMSEIKSNTIRRVGEIPKYGGTVNRDAGLANFRELERAVLAMDVVVRSDKVHGDTRLMGKGDDGRPTFPKGRKDGHGDFLHALGVAWWRARSNVSLENRAELDNNILTPQDCRFEAVGTGGLWSSTWI